MKFLNWLNLESNGITSFSIKPLRFALAVGRFFALLAFGYGVYAISIVFLGMTVPGWASLIASIVFLSGIQLLVLGVIGEYIGKMYMELKQRPAYLIAKTNITAPTDTPKEGGNLVKPINLLSGRQGRRSAMAREQHNDFSCAADHSKRKRR